MILFYALGSGLGHITRATAFLFTQNIDYKEVILLTSPHFDSFKKFVKDFSFKIITYDKFIYGNSQMMQDFLSEVIKKYNIEKIFVDTFPAGFYGELNYFETEIPIFLIQRILKWKLYKPLVFKLPNYKKVYIVENLAEQHFADLTKMIKNYEFIKLKYPKADENNNIKNDFWLIPHSQPFVELEALVNFTLALKKAEHFEGQILMSTFTDYENPQIKVIKKYQIWNLFPFAKKIISAVGFNNANLLLPYLKKTVFLPFERKFDNQNLRLDLLKSGEYLNFAKSQ